MDPQKLKRRLLRLCLGAAWLPLAVHDIGWLVRIARFVTIEVHRELIGLLREVEALLRVLF